MFRVNKLHKYYNRRKSNEIHVLNDITFDFPDKGLVCLFGPSGCGKTTLLNAICGLDSIHSGQIVFEDTTIDRYQMTKWDNIRSDKFGYIFQNYVLFEDISVYENLAFVLKSYELSKAEIDERIVYALSSVGMEKYAKRLPKQLSGGQQQRIAIARALVKSPSIIVADEPTGNLDEKNTNQIMNIIKKLSKDCLVILVTHERRLADFYADQIIELKDGQITNIISNHNTNIFEIKDERTIYLQEFPKKELNESKLSIEYFDDESLKQNLKLRIIVKDGVVYISNNNQLQKTTLLTTQSETKIVDSKKPVITADEIESFEYHLERIDDAKKTKNHYISFLASMRIAWLALQNFGRKKKMYLATFFLAAIMIVITITNLTDVLYTNERDYIIADRNLVSITMPPTTNSLDGLKDATGATKILFSEVESYEPGEAGIQSIIFNVFDQAMYSYYSNIYFRGNSVLPVDVVSDPKLIAGRLPEKYGEITLDAYVLTALLENRNIIRLGGNQIEQFLHLEYTAMNGDQGRIVGITNLQSPVALTTYDQYASIQFTFASDYLWDRFTGGQVVNYRINSSKRYAEDTIIILNDDTEVELRDIVLERNQVIVSDSTMFDGTNMISLFTNAPSSYEVVGRMVTNSWRGEVIVSSSHIESIAEEYLLHRGNVSVYSTNPKRTVEDLAAVGFEAESLLDYMYNQYMLRNAMSLAGLFFPVVVLIASLIFLYFMMRSSIINRIYEVGVYRALGVRRLEVIKIFFAEVLLLTLVTSIPGFLIVSFLIYQLNATFVLVDIFYPWYLALGSLTFILILNFSIGLIPVQKVLKLTPAQILSKYDI